MNHSFLPCPQPFPPLAVRFHATFLAPFPARFPAPLPTRSRLAGAVAGALLLFGAAPVMAQQHPHQAAT
nr:hypothetical protein [uncultured Janthinobacterium sp.]